MSALAGIWMSVWELFFEDGQLAIGILGTIIVCYAVGTFGAAALRPATGWLMLVLLVGLLFVNLYRAGVKARRKVKAR